jgi:hypothetical protein
VQDSSFCRSASSILTMCRRRQALEAPSAWYYLDMPYAIVQRDGELVNELLRGMRVISFLKPHGKKWLNLAIFESQSSYFSMRGRREQFHASFEMIVEKARR